MEPLATVVVFVCVACPVLEMETVYVPMGIQLVVNKPAVLVEAETVVATLPPFIVTVAPLTTAPLGETTFTAIFPPVASGMLRVLVDPPVTAVAIVCGK